VSAPPVAPARYRRDAATAGEKRLAFPLPFPATVRRLSASAALPSAATFTLQPHPAQPAPDIVIDGQVVHDADGLHIDYAVRGDLGRLRLPAAAGVCVHPVDGLWRHTCLELFVAGDAPGAYREFNFSPSGQWASYAFSAYRERDENGERAVPVVLVPPRLVWRRDADCLHLHATLDTRVLPAGHRRFGPAAVIEAVDGDCSYWALHHRSPQPDFHRDDTFTLRLNP